MISCNAFASEANEGSDTAKRLFTGVAADFTMSPTCVGLNVREMVYFSSSSWSETIYPPSELGDVRGVSSWKLLTDRSCLDVRTHSLGFLGGLDVPLLSVLLYSVALKFDQRFDVQTQTQCQTAILDSSERRLSA